MGIEVEEYEDGIAINGPQTIMGGTVGCFGDHRIVMTAAIAGLISSNAIIIDSTASVNTSFPSFWSLLNTLSADLTERTSIQSSSDK